MEKPMLSICIPTYNRAEYLDKCLKAIVKQDGFDDRVEIIISDNCSTDNTQAIGLYYQEKYANIHYYRNDENLIDANFPLAFQRAHGILRKLTNDTIIYRPGAVEYMLTAVEDYRLEGRRPQIYFLNSGMLSADKKQLDTTDAYVKALSFYITWIGSLAIWEDDCNDLNTMTENASTRLAQVPFLIGNFEKHGSAVIYDKPIMHSIVPAIKNLSYGIYHVFYDTFLGFLTGYLEAGKISKECYAWVRKDLLLNFFSAWIVRWKLDRDRYVFSDENLQGLVEKAYRNESYYKKYKIKLLRLYAGEIIRKARETAKKVSLCKYDWSGKEHGER